MGLRSWRDDRRAASGARWIGRQIESSLAGAPEWAMNTRLAAYHYEQLVKNVVALATAVTEGDEPAMDVLAVKMDEHLAGMADLILDIPVADADECLADVEGMRSRMRQGYAPDGDAMNRVAAWLDTVRC